MSKIFRRKWLVTGRVQGVSFRAFVRREALKLELSCSAENLPDGSVRVIAVGQEERLLSLEKHLQKGPPAARVDLLSLIENSIDDSNNDVH